jgi:hypothetical protein
MDTTANDDINSTGTFAQQLAAALQNPQAAYTVPDMLLNMSLALALGLLLASVYRYTHKGLSYSQSFTLTIVFVTTIVAIILMAIESSLARAFALVGALSIIRFRTVVKDTKDTAYVFAGLAVGMAAGTSNYALAVLGGAFISAMALALHHANFGAENKGQFMIRFTFDQSKDSRHYLDVLDKYCRHSRLLHAEPTADGDFVHSTLDVALKNNSDLHTFVSEYSRVEGVSDVRLTTAKNEVDY